MRRGPVFTLGAVFVLGAAAFGAVACGGDDVSKSEYDKVKQDLQDQQAQNQQLQQQIANAAKTPAAASGTAAAGSGGVTWVLGVKKVPPVTPPPTPTPGGPTPTPAPPKPTAPPALYQPVPFTVYMETLATTHQSGLDIAATVACTPSGLFLRGQRIVWRYEVFDTSTGKRLTDQDGAKLKIVLPNGDEVSGNFSQRAGGASPGAPFMWSSNWDIPKEFPLGGIDYKVVITTKDGKSFTWTPPALADKNLKIDTRPTVVGDLQQ